VEDAPPVTDPREHVLASIRSALHARESASPPPGEPAPAATPTAAEPTLPDEQLVILFIDRLRDYGAAVTTCEPDGIAHALQEACRRHHAQRLVVAPGVPERWRPDGVELIADQTLTYQELDAVDGVITGAAAAIATSGTIALDGGPDQGRRAITLIPDLHLCVVSAERVVARLPEALELLSSAVTRDRRPITLISGPSATADIELRRVQGVHGPRRLEVVVSAG